MLFVETKPHIVEQAGLELTAILFSQPQAPQHFFLAWWWGSLSLKNFLYWHSYEPVIIPKYNVKNL